LKTRVGLRLVPVVVFLVALVVARLAVLLLALMALMALVVRNSRTLRQWLAELPTRMTSFRRWKMSLLCYPLPCYLIPCELYDPPLCLFEAASSVCTDKTSRYRRLG